MPPSGASAANWSDTVRVLSPGVDWNTFLERIPAARERVLMLDYDGTLAPFQVRPERPPRESLAFIKRWQAGAQRA